ncbi:MAG: hypothetical protein HC788_03625 [Sphingopyxis sp.]|nr:hypothetical protein [Sphingopyxis sp.]
MLDPFGLATAVHAKQAPPRGETFDLKISNEGCFKGSGIEPYVQQAIAQRRRAARQNNGKELTSFYVPVPSHSWRGLTVTGVGLHYESTSIYFREPLAKVRRVLRTAGVRIAADDSIPIANEEAVEVQRLRAPTGYARQYGVSEIECGV